MRSHFRAQNTDQKHISGSTSIEDHGKRPSLSHHSRHYVNHLTLRYFYILYIYIYTCMFLWEEYRIIVCIICTLDRYYVVNILICILCTNFATISTAMASSMHVYSAGFTTRNSGRRDSPDRSLIPLWVNA